VQELKIEAVILAAFSYYANASLVEQDNDNIEYKRRFFK
jgi:hypothetical protein